MYEDTSKYTNTTTGTTMEVKTLQEAADSVAQSIANGSSDRDEAAKQLAAVLYDVIAQLGTCPHCVIRDTVRLMEDEVSTILKIEDIPEEERIQMHELLHIFSTKRSGSMH